jgi:2-polyprenyl-6-methoxyphenol hydroxylase-like FAD-dependent oxidoreductase
VTISINTALIVGGGIGGMAAAIALAKTGVTVTLIDIDPEWRVYGAGITITGPTLRAYKRLGLIDAIKAQGAITNGSKIFRYDGLFLNALDEPALEEGLPATGGIMRPVLHAIMQAQVRALEINVTLGISVDALENMGQGVDVRFSDGSSGTFDLVIGADGIFSKVRSIAFPNAVLPQPTGQGCWRITMPRPPEFDRGEMYFGHANTAGITACADDQVYMWMLTKGSPSDWIPEAEQHDRLAAHMADFGGNIAWMRDRMTSQTWINYRPLEAAIQPAPWANGRIVLVGDAAHATTPHLASGAGIAVEDGIVLAEELTVPGRSVEESLAHYTARREPRCRDVVETSIAVGTMQLAGAGPQEVGKLIGGALHRLAAPF